MAGKLEYRIIKNKPNFDSNAQYFFNTELEKWYFQTGIESLAVGDDLYALQDNILYKNITSAFTLPNQLLGSDSIVSNEAYFFNEIHDSISDDVPEKDFRYISNVYVGSDYNTGVHLQKYHDLGSVDYIRTSAPNIVTLYFDVAYETGAFEIEEISTTDKDRFNFRYMVLDWDSDDEFLFEDYVLPGNDSQYQVEKQSKNILIPADVYANGGEQVCLSNQNIENETTCNMLQHQYNEPGLKTIRVLGVAWPKIYQEDSDDMVRYIKEITVRLYLGLDGVFIEDFSEVGGPDFIFLPWPYELIPVVGGVAKRNDTDGFGEPKYITSNSQYIKSLNSIIKSNKFESRDILNKALATKAYENDNIGVWPGKIDFAQTRLFMDGSYDLAKLLMIEDSYENTKNFTGKLENYPYTDNFYWDGFINSFPDDSCVGEIFINDNRDYILRSLTLIEINSGELEGTSIRDSSGNGNKAILFGDYAIRKESKELPLVRQSNIDYPDLDTEDGAL
tara:strand:+ start:1449 stop:2960 length:1512 start_codon:yes stop_codon:yes gene_type:complete